MAGCVTKWRVSCERQVAVAHGGAIRPLVKLLRDEAPLELIGD